MILKKRTVPPEEDHRHDDNEELSRLIALAQGGDNEAFGALVEIYEKFVYTTACRTLSSSGCCTSDAEDIAQAAFMKAWRSLSSFRADCAFPTWLYRITQNTARDYIRTHLRHETVSLHTDGRDDTELTIDVPVTEGEEIPEDAFEKKELILAVRAAIAQLPEEQRTVIILRDIEELSYNDISAMLGLEIGTVKSRISRGRLALKELLEGKHLL